MVHPVSRHDEVQIPEPKFDKVHVTFKALHTDVKSQPDSSGLSNSLEPGSPSRHALRAGSVVSVRNPSASGTQCQWYRPRPHSRA